MNTEDIINICRRLPAVTEGVKWGNDLCFMIGEKMFCVVPLDGSSKVSFKVKDDEFDAVSSLPGVIPAPYAARYKWVMVEKMTAFRKKEWESYITQSYDLVRAKLS